MYVPHLLAIDHVVTIGVFNGFSSDAGHVRARSRFGHTVCAHDRIAVAVLLRHSAQILFLLFIVAEQDQRRLT